MAFITKKKKRERERGREECEGEKGKKNKKKQYFERVNDRKNRREVERNLVGGAVNFSHPCVTEWLIVAFVRSFVPSLLFFLAERSLTSIK